MPLRLVPAPLRRRVLDSAEVPADLASVTSIARDEELAAAMGSVDLARLLPSQ